MAIVFARVFWLLLDLGLFIVCFKWLRNMIKDSRTFLVFLSGAICIAIIICTVVDVSMLILVLG